MRRLLLLVCIAVAGALQAAVEERWDVPLQTPPRHDVDVWRGETVALSPRFLDGGAPVAITTNDSIVLYWQTAGMGSSWYSTNGFAHATPGRVTCPFAPACDVGASNYTYFVGLSRTNGRAYRAFGALRMRGAPGAIPNALPLPPQVIDWATITNLHPSFAPFDPSGSAQAVSETLGLSIQTETQARAALGVALSNAVAVALTNWSAALALVAQAGSNYAEVVAGLAAGSTNAAHLAETDPHGDRAWAAGVIPTSSVWRADEAGRLVQIDSNAWVSVEGSNAVLYVVSYIPGGKGGGLWVTNSVLLATQDWALPIDGGASMSGDLDLARYNLTGALFLGLQDSISPLNPLPIWIGDYGGSPIYRVGLDPTDRYFWTQDNLTPAAIGAVTPSDATNTAQAVMANISTNNASVGGWLVWDSGSNVWRKVTCSNLCFYVETYP